MTTPQPEKILLAEADALFKKMQKLHVLVSDRTANQEKRTYAAIEVGQLSLDYSKKMRKVALL